MGEQSVLCILKALSSGGILTTNLTRKGPRVTCLNSSYSQATLPHRERSTQVAKAGEETCLSGERATLCLGGIPLNIQAPLGKGRGRRLLISPCLLLLITPLSTFSKLRLMNYFFFGGGGACREHGKNHCLSPKRSS